VTLAEHSTDSVTHVPVARGASFRLLRRLGSRQPSFFWFAGGLLAQWLCLADARQVCDLPQEPL